VSAYKEHNSTTPSSDTQNSAIKTQEDPSEADTLSQMWAVSCMVYVNIKNKPTGNGNLQLSVISGICCDVDENCTHLRYYTASNGNPLLMFQDNVLVPFSRTS
jgi:hypothetical protein